MFLSVSFSFHGGDMSASLLVELSFTTYWGKIYFVYRYEIQYFLTIFNFYQFMFLVPIIIIDLQLVVFTGTFIVYCLLDLLDLRHCMVIST